MWFVYILKCKNEFLYTGITTNLERRFQEHLKREAHFTSYNPPLSIAYTESHPTRSAALKREAGIKKLPRTQKLALISKNPAHPLINSND